MPSFNERASKPWSAGSNTSTGSVVTIALAVVALIGNIASAVATAPNLSGDVKQWLVIGGSVAGFVGTAIATIAGLSTPPPVAVGGQGLANDPAAAPLIPNYQHPMIDVLCSC